MADHAGGGHLLGAVVGVLVHGEIGRLGVDLVVLDSGGGGVGVRLGGGQERFLGCHLIQDLLLIELGEKLALMDVGVDIGMELGDDSGGLGFDLDFSDRLHFARGDDGSCDVSALRLGELRGLDLGSISTGGDGDSEENRDDHDGDAGPEPDPAFPFALVCHDSLQGRPAEVRCGLWCAYAARVEVAP